MLHVCPANIQGGRGGTGGTDHVHTRSPGARLGWLIIKGYFIYYYIFKGIFFSVTERQKIWSMFFKVKKSSARILFLSSCTNIEGKKRFLFTEEMSCQDFSFLIYYFHTWKPEKKIGFTLEELMNAQKLESWCTSASCGRHEYYNKIKQQDDPDQDLLSQIKHSEKDLFRSQTDL